MRRIRSPDKFWRRQHTGQARVGGPRVTTLKGTVVLDTSRLICLFRFRMNGKSRLIRPELIGWISKRFIALVCIFWMLLIAAAFWALHGGPWYSWVAARDPALLPLIESTRSILSRPYIF
jgi:hypothetical protein